MWLVFLSLRPVIFNLTMGDKHIQTYSNIFFELRNPNKTHLQQLRSERNRMAIILTAGGSYNYLLLAYL